MNCLILYFIYNIQYTKCMYTLYDIYILYFTIRTNNNRNTRTDRQRNRWSSLTPENVFWEYFLYQDLKSVVISGKMISKVKEGMYRVFIRYCVFSKEIQTLSLFVCVLSFCVISLGVSVLPLTARGQISRQQSWEKSIISRKNHNIYWTPCSMKIIFRKNVSNVDAG